MKEAVEKDDDELLTMMLDHGYPFDSPKHQPCKVFIFSIVYSLQALLHLCALNNSHDCLLVLISKGHQTDPIDNERKTPLMICVEKGYNKVGRVLVELGAEIEAKSVSGI